VWIERPMHGSWGAAVQQCTAATRPMWRDSGVCGLMGGHNGGRPFALSEAMVTTAIEAAAAESMTLRRIAQRVEEVHGVPFPCHLDTLSIALKRAGFSYKRGRYSLKKNVTPRSSL
jgi:transposase